MEILEGTIMLGQDVNPAEDGTFNVECKDGQVPVMYCSPIGSDRAGLVGIPREGTLVAITKTDRGNYIFLGSIFDSAWVYQEGVDKSEMLHTSKIPDKNEIYKYNGVPQKFVLKDPSNNRIWLNHKRASTDDGGDKEDRGILAITELGKHLVMHDNKDLEDIVLADRAKDIVEQIDDRMNYISIVKNVEDGRENKSIYVQSTNLLHMGTRGLGDINLEVERADTDVAIRVTNNSNGSVHIYAGGGTENKISTTHQTDPTLPTPLATNALKAATTSPTPGSINIVAETGVVNVVAREGQLNVHANEDITLKSLTGDILLEAVEGDIELKTMVGDILFNSAKDLKEEVGGNQETNVTGTITIKASTVDFSNS